MLVQENILTSLKWDNCYSIYSKSIILNMIISGKFNIFLIGDVNEMANIWPRIFGD